MEKCQLKNLEEVKEPSTSNIICAKTWRHSDSTLMKYEWEADIKDFFLLEWKVSSLRDKWYLISRNNYILNHWEKKCGLLRWGPNTYSTTATAHSHKYHTAYCS